MFSSCGLAKSAEIYLLFSHLFAPKSFTFPKQKMSRFDIPENSSKASPHVSEVVLVH